MKKIAIIGILALMPFTVGATESCPEGQVWQEEVSHSITVVDTESFDEVVHHDAVTHQSFHPGYPFEVKVNHIWGHYVTVIDTPAYDETVHHDAITHEETVVDQEAGCVEDTVPPVEPAPEPETPVKNTGSSHPSGSRHPVQLANGTWYCPSPLSPSNDPFNHCPHAGDVVLGGGSIVQLQQQLLSLLQKLVANLTAQLK